MPRDRRDAEWVDRFWDSAWTAALVVTDPPVITGPDGFPYLRLDLPADTSSFDANSLMQVAESLVEQGVGAAIFASGDDVLADAQFAMSMGVLDSILHFDDPAGESWELEEWRQAPPRDALDVTIDAGTRIIVSTPSNHYLSRPAARALHRHLVEQWGLADPRVALLDSPSLRPSRSLVIGVTARELRGKGATEARSKAGWNGCAGICRPAGA